MLSAWDSSCADWFVVAWSCASTRCSVAWRAWSAWRSEASWSTAPVTVPERTDWYSLRVPVGALVGEQRCHVGCGPAVDVRRHRGVLEDRHVAPDHLLVAGDGVVHLGHLLLVLLDLRQRRVVLLLVAADLQLLEQHLGGELGRLLLERCDLLGVLVGVGGREGRAQRGTARCYGDQDAGQWGEGSRRPPAPPMRRGVPGRGGTADSCHGDSCLPREGTGRQKARRWACPAGGR